MTDAMIGYGAEFWLENDMGVLTQIAEVTAVSPPNSQTADVEATHFKSPNRRREYIAGLIDDGEGTIEMNYVAGSSSDELIREAQSSGEARNYRMVLPAASGEWEIEGQCIVKGYERAIPIDDRMTATLTVRFTGEAVEGTS